MNLRKLGRDVKLAFVRHDLGTAADGLDGDFIAAGEGQDRLQFRVEVAPVTGFGAGMQVVMGHEKGFWLLQGRRMTLYQTLSEASLVFCHVQNARLPAVADEFPDRYRIRRRHFDGDAL